MKQPNNDKIDYTYRPLSEVGAMPPLPSANEAKPPSTLWDAPTSPLRFNLWDSLMANHLDDDSYRSQMGETQYQEWLQEENEKNLLKNYTDSVGLAVNLFQLRNVFHDPDQAAIAAITVEGNSSRKNLSGDDPQFIYSFFPFEKPKQAKKIGAAAFIRSLRLDDDDMVSFQAAKPVHTLLNPYSGWSGDERLELEDNAPLLSIGRIKLNLAAMLEKLRESPSEGVSPERVAREMNRILSLGIVGVAQENADFHKKYIPYGGYELHRRRIYEALDERKDIDSIDTAVSAGKKMGSTKEQRTARDTYYKRKESVEKVKKILERGPIVGPIDS